MYPIITQIGPFTLHSFGAMLVIAILTTTWWLTREMRRLGDPCITEDLAQKLVWWGGLGLVLGGHIMYCLVEIGRGNTRFLAAPWTMLYVWEGGLVMYGGFIGVFIAVVAFSRLHHINVLRLCDLVAPAAFLGQSIGRWGCLFAGDDFGRPVAESHWWTITFPPRAGTLIPPEFIDVPLHPAQIYMSIKAFTIFLILTWITRHKKFDGQVAGWSFMLYAFFRTVVELFRGDEDRGILTSIGSWDISTATFTSLLGVFLGLSIVVLAARRTLEDELACAPASPREVEGTNRHLG
jgi:phosphatidylglycerol:prolipoprotein diacylglycerol transferase